MTALKEDAKWPRAAHWLKPYTDGESVDLAVYGVRASQTSISPTGAHTTPDAIRQALLRYSTWSWSHELDLSQLTARDLGNSESPDSPEGEEVTKALAKKATDNSRLSIALGGDNSVTFATMAGGMDLKTSGLITFDAHHDLRDGVSNGSPVRRLVEAGLAGNKIVQIGINDFSNSPEYARLAKELGILVITRAQLRHQTPEEIWLRTIGHLGNVENIHVDIDVDVCDRSVVPACPAAAPGGISADELRQFALLAGRTNKVKTIDITEIDATADSQDQRTIRLAALLILEAATGLALR
jgi:arginase family enzyme